MMRAWVLRGPGGTDAFELEERPVPDVPPGHVGIEIAAFGLNRSELFSRRGMSSPDFSYPRVLGLECVGRVFDPGGSDLTGGERVMALMGGMGRSYDGGYATHTVVPRTQVFRIDAPQDDAAMGAIPETYNTAYGVCLEALQLQAADVVLVRGGTSALGMAAADIAKGVGATVVATTRNPAKAALLEERSHADHVVLDGDGFVERVRAAVGAVTAVVDCVGSKASIESNCDTMPHGGRLGLVGQLAETWDRGETPVIPDNVRKSFTRSDLVAAPADDARMAAIVSHVANGQWRPNVHRTFSFAELPDAHGVMERNEAVGKLVVTT